jgi:predicted phosphodiesterase
LEAEQTRKDTVILGDLFVHGPSPEEVFEIVKDLPVRYWIMGNHDYYIAKGLIDNPDEVLLGKPVKEKNIDQKFAELIESMHWWREKIGKNKCIEFFSKFKSIAIHKQNQAELIFCHAMPWDYENAPNTQDLAVTSKLEEGIRHSSYIYEPEEQPDHFIYISGHTHIFHITFHALKEKKRRSILLILVVLVYLGMEIEKPVTVFFQKGSHVRHIFAESNMMLIVS